MKNLLLPVHGFRKISSWICSFSLVSIEMKTYREELLASFLDWKRRHIKRGWENYISLLSQTENTEEIWLRFFSSFMKYMTAQLSHFWYNRYKLNGNSLKLFLRICLSEKRKNFFTLHAVKAWNELRENVVRAPAVDAFKNRLDQFWSSKDVMWTYQADFYWILSIYLFSYLLMWF